MFWGSVLWSGERNLELFSLMGRWRKKNEAYAEKNTLPTVKHDGGSVMLWGGFASSCHWKVAACGRQDGFIEASGNPRTKHHAICEETKAWASFTLPTGQ